MELAENVDAAADFAGVEDCIQGFPGQDFDLQEFTFIFFRAVHGDDYGATVVADALGMDVCAIEGCFDDGGFFGVRGGREGNLRALRGKLDYC